MNKFEDKTFEILCDEISMVETMFGPQIEGRSTSANRISILHDNEMIAFAEWVGRAYVIYELTPDERIECDMPTTLYAFKSIYSGNIYATSELLTIFREENK